MRTSCERLIGLSGIYCVIHRESGACALRKGVPRGKHSPEVIAKIAAKNTGKSRTEEQRARMRAIKLNTSLETRAKMSAAAKGNKRCLGRKMSAATMVALDAGRREAYSRKLNG